MKLDLLIINPGGREAVYQNLGNDLAAIEPPLWCRLIGGFIRDRSFNISILDSEALSMGPADIAQEVEKLQPRLVAMVVFGHQPSASTQSMVGARLALQAIKEKAADIPVIIVGGHVSALPEQTLREEPVDFVCKGEGPWTVLGLLENKSLEEIPGLVYWDSEKNVKLNLAAPLFTDLDQDLHGNVWDLLPMEKYRAHNWQCFGDLTGRMPYASIYTSLGCPYKCSFCCINAPFDASRYRMRNPLKVVEEIDLLHNKYGVKTIKIIDEMFVLNQRHVTEICDLLIGRNYGLNIWAYARVDTVKPTMLEKLRKAGIKWLALGIESGSAHVRDGAQKRLDQEGIINIVREIQKADINVIGNYIFGLPDDDIKSMQETLDLALELNCEFANFYSAMAYPGSALYKEAVAKGWELPASWSGFSQHSYDCQPLPTEKVSAAQVLAFRDSAFDKYFAAPRYLDMVAQRFGWETRNHIQEMAKHKLKRKLLE